MGQDQDLSEDLCGNPSCECHPKSGEDYCSDDCQKNATAPDHVCKCGHDNCSDVPE